MSRLIRRSLVVAALVLAFLPGRADASLTTFATYSGNVGYSSDGFGSTSQSGTISASVPVGSTVLAAFLYTATNSVSGGSHAGGGTLNGNPVAYGAPVLNTAATVSGIPFLAMQRADVTAIVKPLIDGGLGGVYNFTVTETNVGQDGEALIVVYSNPLNPIATVGILDGFSAPGGDTTSINFANPLDPAAPGFFAEMIIGDSFSAGSGSNQTSTITVNGTTITTNAGGFDDGQLANGALMTVGGYDDPFSPLLPTGANDHEKYNLVPYVQLNDTSITVNTNNPSNDDNIFLATFYVSGVARINEPPVAVPDQSETLLLLSLALAGIWAVSYRRA